MKRPGMPGFGSTGMTGWVGCGDLFEFPKDSKEVSF